jgi:prolyl 4-hydroxylase
MITVFLYLNDVEAGGGTDFPLLGLTVMPKRGTALIWPSVRDDDPSAKDGRTEHQVSPSKKCTGLELASTCGQALTLSYLSQSQALPVEAGTKYGANAWVHQRSFKEPYAKSCI